MWLSSRCCFHWAFSLQSTFSITVLLDHTTTLWPTMGTVNYLVSLSLWRRTSGPSPLPKTRLHVMLIPWLAASACVFAAERCRCDLFCKGPDPLCDHTLPAWNTSTTGFSSTSACTHTLRILSFSWLGFYRLTCSKPASCQEKASRKSILSVSLSDAPIHIQHDISYAM